MTDLLRRGVAVLGVVAVLASACTSNSPGTPPTRATTPHSSAAGTTSRRPVSHVPAPSSRPPHLVPVTQRCGLPEVRGARTRFVAGPGRARLPVVEVGQGPTTALFLHQIDGDGLCGWWPFAAWLVQHYPVRAVLADLCGYGASYCPGQKFAADQLRQVRVLARSAVRTGRFVLVGASMGGALALASAAPTHADALVDLSGPPNWPGAPAAAAVPHVTVPTLIADSRGDPAADYGQLRRAFGQIPARQKTFVTGDGAHGWNLLSSTGTAPFTPLARTVADWIVGRYPG